MIRALKEELSRQGQAISASSSDDALLLSTEQLAQADQFIWGKKSFRDYASYHKWEVFFTFALPALVVGAGVFAVTAGVAGIPIATAFTGAAVLAALGAGSVLTGGLILGAAVLLAGLLALGIFAWRHAGSTQWAKAAAETAKIVGDERQKRLLDPKSDSAHWPLSSTFLPKTNQAEDLPLDVLRASSQSTAPHGVSSVPAASPTETKTL